MSFESKVLSPPRDMGLGQSVCTGNSSLDIADLHERGFTIHGGAGCGG